MRVLAFVAILLASASAWGQEFREAPLTLPAAKPKVSLSLSVEQAMMIAQTLGQVGGCDRVSGMATCDMARALIREIQEQVKAQERK